MRVDHPTHVVTVTVWSPSTRETQYSQMWVDVGPFPAGDLDSAIREAIHELTERRVELVEYQASTSSKERAMPAPWEQLSLL